MKLLKRLTMIVKDRTIEHSFYPVFPPNESAEEVLRWLRANRKLGGKDDGFLHIKPRQAVPHEFVIGSVGRSGTGDTRDV